MRTPYRQSSWTNKINKVENTSSCVNKKTKAKVRSKVVSSCALKQRSLSDKKQERIDDKQSLSQSANIKVIGKTEKIMKK
ncbi:unnamed protein product [Rotaria magnacalcarata]